MFETDELTLDQCYFQFVHFNIPSPGSAFSIVSPRRRISCESENDIEIVSESRDMSNNETIDTTGIEKISKLRWPSENSAAVLDSQSSYSDNSEKDS